MGQRRLPTDVTPEHIERIDGDLLADLGLNPEGTLVRDEIRKFVLSGDRVGPGAAVNVRLESRHRQRPAGPAPHRVLRPQRIGCRLAGLEELVRWVHATPAGPAFAAGFAERFDVDEVLTWLAIHAVVADVDTFGGDYWRYVDHTTPGSRWQVIHWDKDLTFGSHSRAAAPRPGTANAPSPTSTSWNRASTTRSSPRSMPATAARPAQRPHLAPARRPPLPRALRRAHQRHGRRHGLHP